MRFAARITPWRENFEQDPSVTFKSIAEEIGCTAQCVSAVAKKHGWTASEAVAKARRQVHFVPRAKGATPKSDLSLVKPAENTAWTSVFSFGEPISTQRHGPVQSTTNDTTAN